MRIYVDGWDPSYGNPIEAVEGGPTAESTAPVKLDIELDPSAWRFLAPPPELRAPETVLLVDGVRRIDARVIVEEADGALQPGIAASYAAGVVRCDLRGGRAEVIAATVERGLFTPSADAGDLVTGTTRYTVHRAAVSEPAQLTQAAQSRLQALEVEVSGQARVADDLLVVDGRLRERSTLPRTLGYIKTHHQQYLPPQLSTVVGRLCPGQRSPVFLLGNRWQTFSWYLKLPSAGALAPWAGVVRVECGADVAKAEAIHLADLSAVTLPRFASTAYKDPRAPQNLTPIAGLERRLKSMLGDQRLLLRGLTSAAAAQRTLAAA